MTAVLSTGGSGGADTADTRPGPEYLERPEIVGVAPRRARWLAGIALVGVAVALTVVAVVALVAALVTGVIVLLVVLYMRIFAPFSMSGTEPARNEAARRVDVSASIS